MTREIIHTATCITELKGWDSGRARTALARKLTPEQRERVLAQEARWEAFQRAEWEGEAEPEPEEITPKLLCDVGLCMSQGEARRFLLGEARYIEEMEAAEAKMKRQAKAEAAAKLKVEAEKNMTLGDNAKTPLRVPKGIKVHTIAIQQKALCFHCGGEMPAGLEGWWIRADDDQDGGLFHKECLEVDDA